MLRVIAVVDAATLSTFDEIIDVRSPAEFAEDHVPRAINLPVLSDSERAEVGTLYVQVSTFQARLVGAAHVAQNVSEHLRGALADKPKAFAPLIYCWRGGQRSHAMASVLSQIGWRVTLIEGGYKTYRRYVTARLYDDPQRPDAGRLDAARLDHPPLRVVLLDGGTGSAKTEILHRLAERGFQILDLEGLAEHRGSLFGGAPGRRQPSQKLFETRLQMALERLDRSRPVVIEAESSKVGDRFVPPVVWRAMQAASRIELIAPEQERARYLVQAYGAAADDLCALHAALGRLPAHHGHKQVESWRAMVNAGEFEALALALIQTHYDPAYRRSGARESGLCLGRVRLGRLDEAGQNTAADEVGALLAKA